MACIVSISKVSLMFLTENIKILKFVMKMV